MTNKLVSTAQELIVLDPNPATGVKPAGMEIAMPIQSLLSHTHHSHEPLEITEPVEIEIVIDDLPGAPKGTKDPEPVLEVEEKEEEKKEDENDLAETPGKWDWKSRGAQGFITWVKERIDDVPKHSGMDTAGLARACAYLEKLDDEISKAMRLDLDGELDANKIEEVRAQIENGIDRLTDRLDKIKDSKKKSRRKKADFDQELVKEAQKITGVKGVMVVVPLLISRLARICINGAVSAGHDIERVYADQVKKYKLNDREQAELTQLISDMGYFIREDRGLMNDEVWDTSSTQNYDTSALYKA